MIRWRVSLSVLLVPLALAVVPVAPTPAWSQGPTKAVAPEGSDRVTTRAAGTFADEFLPKQLEEQEIPGASVAIVSTEGTMARGYGTADLASGRAVDPGRTVFAPASVAKLLTATAVMQLVEDGRLDPNADVNTYLEDFRIDDGDFAGRPITVEHLLTHTAGFAGGDSGTAAATPEAVHPLGRHLERHQPPRIRPPGSVAVYSNYGMALAGYLVEERTGMPFHQYVRSHILRPLGMNSTTFAQPAPLSIEDRLATGYLVGDGSPVPTKAANHGHMPPHGAGFRSTAADMARFLRAHLEDGRGILEPESARLMRQRHFGNGDDVPGMGLGFWEYNRNGNRLLVHRGSIPGYLAVFAMLPDEKVGIYASYNSTGRDGGRAAWELVDAFVDRFAEGAPPGSPAGNLPDPERFAGRYGSMQAGDSADLGRLRTLTGGVSVTAGPSGDLVTDGPVTHADDGKQRWIQVEPGLFREHDGRRTIRFRGNGILATENPADPYVRLAWHELPETRLVVLVGSLTILLASTMVWPVTHVIRTRKRRVSRWSRWAEGTAWLAGALVLASAGSVAVMFANFEQNQEAYFRGSSPLLSAIRLLPVLAAAATVAAATSNLVAWRRRWWSLTARLHHALVVGAAIGYLAIGVAYNVLG